jgi:hypothetical protein
MEPLDAAMSAGSLSLREPGHGDAGGLEALGKLEKVEWEGMARLDRAMWLWGQMHSL